MKQLIILWVVLIMSWGFTEIIQAQNIVAVEYFIDNDPGHGNATAIPVTTPAASINLTTDIIVPTLAPGFHTLHVRTLDDNGHWSFAESKVFSVGDNNFNIVAAEYFIDTDPGFGNGSPLNIGTAGTSVNFTDNIATTDLAPGAHTLYVRTLSSNGTWSFPTPKLFTIADTQFDIVAAEYFIDADPGFGNGNALDIGTAGASVNFNDSIPTTGLAPGAHTLYVRTLSSNGTWSFPTPRQFTIANTQYEIVAAEYFFNTDPGFGNGTALNIGTAGPAVDFDEEIPTTGLAPGAHTLYVRTLSNNGTWSFPTPQQFTVGNTDAYTIVAAEYYLDTDPGVGNGTALPITTSNDTTYVNSSITLPANLTNGEHYVCVRTQSSAGKWSFAEVDTILVQLSAAVVSPIADATLQSNFGTYTAGNANSTFNSTDLTLTYSATSDNNNVMVSVDGSGDIIITSATDYTGQANITITAEDPDGNMVEDEFVVFIINTLQVQVLLEGAYNTASTMTTDLNSNGLIPTTQPYNTAPWNYSGTESLTPLPSDVVDWVLLEARDANNPNTVLATQAVLLRNDGMLLSVDASGTDVVNSVQFNSLSASADYYFVIRHRNHLDISSASALSLNNTSPYDFTDVNNVFEGNSQVKELAASVYGMHSGDIDANGVFTFLDFNEYAAQSAQINDYLKGDVNLDGSVTIDDFNSYLPNASVIGVDLIRY